jgi:hypothetical protein
MKLYNAVVWVRDEPGERVSLRAESPDEARRELKARYGDDAVVTLSDDDEAAKPR